MKISHNDDSWHARGVIKRDFQHDHSGPEEMPHRKKRKKNSGAVKGDHKHLWETNGWEKQYRTHYKFNPSADRDDPRRWVMVIDKTNWILVRHYECLECGKPGKRQVEYPKGRPYYWYYDPTTATVIY